MNGRIRICHLGKFYPPANGGMETHVRTLARAQADLGAEVHVVCVNHLDAVGRDVTWSTFARTETTEEYDGPVRITRLGRRASVARLDVCPGLPGMLAACRRPAVDLLHLHVPNPTMLLALAVLSPRSPLVVTYHSDVVKQKLLRHAVWPFEYRILRRAAVILSTSAMYPPGSATLQRHIGKVRALPLGIDLGPYLTPSPAAREHARRMGEEYGKPLWLAVGRLVYYKGLHNAIRALREVPGKLLVIGQGPLGGELRRLAAEMGVAERVIWRERAGEDELIGAYHAATALWFPSTDRSEGFGLVQVEAMASGCPVINAAVPHSGVSWVSRDGATGLTVPVNDPEALARAAVRLVEEPGLRERLATGAVRRAVNEFDQALMGRRSLDVYHGVLAMAPSGSGVPAARLLPAE